MSVTPMHKLWSVDIYPIQLLCCYYRTETYKVWALNSLNGKTSEYPNSLIKSFHYKNICFMLVQSVLSNVAVVHLCVVVGNRCLREYSITDCVYCTNGCCVLYKLLLCCSCASHWCVDKSMYIDTSYMVSLYMFICMYIHMYIHTYIPVQ